MPAASITSSFNKSIREIGVLSSYMNDCSTLESKYQYFIGEVVMLRLFAILESNICDVALRLACGTPYKSGTLPIRLINCLTIGDANFKMLSHGRRRPRPYLKWTYLSGIQDSIEHVLDLNDHFFVNINNHISLIDEMRDIRNHIAHRTSGTAVKYYNQLNSIYNANLRLPIGAFLTSKSRNPQSNIERYLLSMPIILHDISKG